jgi:hypothetical protein
MPINPENNYHYQQRRSRAKFAIERARTQPVGIKCTCGYYGTVTPSAAQKSFFCPKCGTLVARR